MVNTTTTYGVDNNTNKDLRNISQYNINLTTILDVDPAEKSFITGLSNDFFAYVTPVILLIGLCGNGLSLCVFLSRNMRALTASRYLAALSTADITTLIFYVLVEWLRRGLIHISPGVDLSFVEANGVCQLLLYFSYVSRLMSAWLIVVFTIERYVGVCHPFKKRDLDSSIGTLKIVLALLFISCILVLYKPILSQRHTIRGQTACSSIPEYKFVSFLLDSIFAVMITLIPFIIISVLNCLIIRRLFLRHRRTKDHLITEETTIRLEFTLILLAISVFFVAFNVPFFIVWLRHFLNSRYLSPSYVLADSGRGDIDYWNSVLRITRTIFYMNYCVNFFLYSITGAYFRRQLKALFTIRRRQQLLYQKCSTPASRTTRTTHVNNRNSWV